MEEYMLPCMNKSLFGIECFGCGSQRAFLFLIHGEFEKAFLMFPAVYTTILLILFLGLHIIDKNGSYYKIVIFLAITNAIIMVVAYLYKLLNF